MRESLHVSDKISFKNRIREKIGFKKEYSEALLDLKTYEKYIKQTECNEKIEKWFVKYNISLTYLKLKDSKLALRYAKQSVRYCSTQEDYIKNLWLLDSCFEIQHNIMKSGEAKDALLCKRNSILQRCVDCYRELISDSMTTLDNKIKFRLLQLTVMFNMAKLHDDIDGMLNVVQILNNLDDSILHIASNKKDEQKEYLLLATAKELIDVYTRNENILDIRRLINLMNDKKIKNELNQYLKVNKVLTIK